MITRSVSVAGRPTAWAAGWPAGPRSWIWSRQRRSSVRDWHQSSIVPTSVTRAARLTGTRSAFALRPTRIRLCKRRQLADRVGVGAHQVARLVVGPDRAAGQRKDDRLAHQEVEVVAGDRDLVALLGVARHNAKPRSGRLPGLEPDVERTRRSAADPDPAAPANDSVIGRSLGHGQVERDVGEDARRIGRPGVIAEPRGHDLDDPVAHDYPASSAPPLKRIASGRAGRSSAW